MKKRFAMLVLVLLPVAAGAQVGPPIAPMRVPPAAASPGITVTGMAQQRVAVRTLMFTAYARGSADEASVLAAMRAAGIADPSVASADFSSGTVLHGTVNDVTRAKLQAIGVAAADYGRTHPGASVSNVQYSAPLAGCPALEAPARERAFTEARRRAEAVARAAGVGLGPVLAVVESGGCPAALGDATIGSPVDPVTLTTTLTLIETATFGIVTPDAPNRRRTL